MIFIENQSKNEKSGDKSIKNQIKEVNMCILNIIRIDKKHDKYYIKNIVISTQT